jgi:GT2 family glycosyltransferase
VATLLIELDLDAPPRAPIHIGGHSMVRVLVRRGAEPLGQVNVPVSADLSPEVLVAAAARLAGAQREPQPTVAAMPMVTVAVCTRGRPDELGRCLDALRAQREAPPHEIVVVDNAPTGTVTRELVARFPECRYVVEEPGGLGFARNRALLEARGEVLAFVDDDALPAEGWLRAVASVFAADPSIGVCGGPTVPVELETRAQELFEERGGFPQDFERRVYGLETPAGWHSRHWPLLAGSLFSGCNLALRVEPLHALGGFDDAMGPGTPTTGGDDHDIVYRLLVAGQQLAVEPTALMRHRHRPEMAALESQLRSWGCGTVAFLTKCGRGGPRRRARSAAIIAWLVLHHLRRLVGTGRPSSPRPFPRGLVVDEIVGCVQGLVAYRRSERYVRRERARASARRQESA